VRTAFAASVLAGLLTGIVDALLGLAGSPDPAFWSYRLGYVLGPLLVALGWAIPLGLLAGAIGGPGASAGAVVGLWIVSLLIDAWHAGQGPPALAMLALGAGLGALALGRLARDGAAGLTRWPAPRRRLVWAVGATALVAATAATAPTSLATFHGGTGPCPAADARPEGPSLLLVTVDALRADAARDMRSYRRLAAHGTEFAQHVTTSPWTLPSVASLLTGREPAEHRAGESLSDRALLAKTRLRAELPTLAGVLGARGYRTHAVVTNPFLTARYGIDAGFCSFENVTMQGEAARGLAQTVPLRLLRAFAPALLPSDRARSVRARAADWLAANGDHPFFLWVHFLDPHAPYGDRDGASTSLVLDLLAFEASRGPEVPFRGLARVRAGEYRPDAAERQRIEGLYREDVAYADAEIEALLDVLERLELGARTAIVFTADHGEEFWEHGGVEHGRTLYEEVLHVPLVIVPPGGGEHAVRRELTAVEDVAASSLDLLGVPRAGIPGADLVAGPAPPERALALGNLLFGEEWTGVRTPVLKYMRSQSGEERLYDLARDPGERLNVVAAEPEAAAAARALAGQGGARPSAARDGPIRPLGRARRSEARGAAPRIAPSPCESAPMPKSSVSRRQSRSRSRASTWCTPASSDTSPPTVRRGYSCVYLPDPRTRPHAGAGGHLRQQSHAYE